MGKKYWLFIIVGAIGIFAVASVGFAGSVKVEMPGLHLDIQRER